MKLTSFYGSAYANAAQGFINTCQQWFNSLKMACSLFNSSDINI